MLPENEDKELEAAMKQYNAQFAEAESGGWESDKYFDDLELAINHIETQMNNDERLVYRRVVNTVTNAVETKASLRLLYDAKPNLRYRVAFNYKGELRPFFWFKVTKAGDIYLGPRYEKIAFVQKSTQEIIDEQSFIRFGEGEIFDDPSLLKGAKLSIHPGGLVNFSGIDHKLRDSLKSLDKQQLLCLIFFEHPKKWSTITNPKVRRLFELSD